MTRARRPCAKSTVPFPPSTLSIDGSTDAAADPVSWLALPPSSKARKLLAQLFAREKRRPRSLVDLPRKHAWRTIHSAESLLLGERLSRPDLAERQIRGAVLISGYAIEHLLGVLIGQIFFPNGQVNSAGQKRGPATDQKKRRSLFDHCFLKSGLLGFRAKIDTLKIALSRMPSLTRVIPKELVSRLRQVIDLRNRFALYPVTFTRFGDPPHQCVRASLVCHDKEILLNEAFLIDMDRLFDSTLSDLKQILKSVRRKVC